MSSGECPKCGRIYKRLDNHLKCCKSEEKQEEPPTPPANQETSNPQEEKPFLEKVLDNNPDIREAMTKEEPLILSSPSIPSEPPILSTNQVTQPEKQKQGLWEWVFGDKKIEPIEVTSPEDLIEGMESYQIPMKSPKAGFFGRLFHKDQDYIQVVLVSELVEPKMFWAEKTGMNYISFKDRMFKLPRDVKGNVFFWHIDKQESLIDTAGATLDDAEDSMHMQRVANQYYALGREVGAPELMANLRLLLLAIGFTILLLVGVAVYISTVKKAIDENDAQIISTLNFINSTRNP